jgi:hypothetical protein
MPSNVQWRKQNEYYTWHKILQILTVIGQLCALYVISLLLAQRQFTKQTTRFLNTAIDSLLKHTNHTMGKSYNPRWENSTRWMLMVWNTCSYHLDQGNIEMVMPLVPAATRECAQTWQTREPYPTFAIANSFVIGSFPQKIEFTNKDSKRKARHINNN